jgi:outer membrane receptor for ferrienterochelin and colicins
MTSRSVLRRVLLAGAGICALHPAASWAQAVDYGTLEQVFGEPITTSVTGKPQRASEVPGDITIITQDDIRRSGATDIPTILQFVTGVDVRRYSFGDAEVAIRGYDSPINPRLLVLVNGRQVRCVEHDPGATRRDPPDRGHKRACLGIVRLQRRKRRHQHRYL